MSKGLHLATGLDIIENLGTLLSGKFRRTKNVAAGIDDNHPFARHYREQIMPLIDGFERDRLEVLRITRKRMLIGLCITGIGFFGPVIMQIAGTKFGNPLIVPFICLTVMSRYVPGPAIAYKESVKGLIFPVIFSYFGDDFRYDRNGGPGPLTLTRSGLIPNHDHAYTEDYIKGSYRGIPLELTEMRLTVEKKSRRGTSEVTIFKGLCILFSAHKPFAGITYAKSDLGVFNFMHNQALQLTRFERVRLEDPVFEGRFQVYSSDQIEARYLLTPAFMERLLALAGKFDSGNVEFSFFDNKLLIKISSDVDYFGVASIFDPVTFETDIKTIFEEMDLIFEIIDLLKLTERTGL